MGIDDVSLDTLKGSVLHQLVDQIRQGEEQIQFLDPDAVGELLANMPGDVRVAVTGILDISLLTEVKRVQVDITGGTATGKRLFTNGVAGAVGASAVLQLEDGQGTIQYTATSVGTVILGLTDIDTSGLLTTDVKTITLT